MHLSEQQPTCYVRGLAAAVINDAQAQAAAVPKRSAIVEEPVDDVVTQVVPEVAL
jgi:hypothetical protein